METIKFSPNNQNIKKRSEIKPSEKCQKFKDNEFSVIQFIYEGVVKIEHSPVKTETVKLKSNYVGRTFDSICPEYDANKNNVRITNIPNSITSNNDLKNLIDEKAKDLYFKCKLIMDRETNKSRGFAFVICKSHSDRVKFVKLVNEIVIDNLQLCADMVEDR